VRLLGGNREGRVFLICGGKRGEFVWLVLCKLKEGFCCSFFIRKDENGLQECNKLDSRLHILSLIKIYSFVVGLYWSSIHILSVLSDKTPIYLLKSN